MPLYIDIHKHIPGLTKEALRARTSATSPRRRSTTSIT